MEFGSRRAQGYDEPYGARAAIIGGCSSTACTIADENVWCTCCWYYGQLVQLYLILNMRPLSLAEAYPDDCTLLVDTYNVLKSGIPNAIKSSMKS